jgi:release factor glutamine methyltransferase
MPRQKTVGQWLSYATELLKNNDVDSSYLDAQLLLSHVTNLTRERILIYPDTKINLYHRIKLDRLLKKRIKHQPIAYLTNEKEFYGKKFFINRDVLIPRPESEDFIVLAKSLNLTKKQSLLDIGTGSGVLALTIKNEFPSWDVTGSDISKKALEVARINQSLLNINVKFIESDLLSALDDNFSIIFANLPYVPQNLITSDEIKSEPRIALFSGHDGLDLYRRLFSEKKIHTETILFIESLTNQQSEIDDIANQNSFTLLKRHLLVSVYKKH